LPLPETILSSNTQSQIALQEAEGCSTSVNHEDDPRWSQYSCGGIANYVANIVTNDDNDSDARLSIPIRATKMSKSTDCPGCAMLVCNPDFLARLTHILQASEAYQQAKRNAELEKRATDSFARKLRVEITKCRYRLHRLSPDIRLAKQYDVFDNATGGSSLTALKLERKLAALEAFLERALFRCADTLAALEQQWQNLCAAQAAVNAEFEKAFYDAGLLGDGNNAPSGVQASDVIGEYKAFCRQNSITWEGCEAELLPESLMVGAATEEIDWRLVFSSRKGEALSPRG
jgi:hypothetical protein